MTAPKKKLPDWVAEQIAVKTGLDKTHLSRACRPRRCARCQAGVYDGLDADVCALRAVVDRQPLSALGEALAALGGLHTYERHSEGGRFVLDLRTADYIASRPAGITQRNDVHAAHKCGMQWPAGARAPTAFPDKTLQARAILPPY